MITKMQVLCMFLLIPSFIMATGQKDKYVNQRLATSECVYPKYLREGPWIDQTSNPGYEFSFGDSIFKEHKDVIHGRMNWTCVKTLKEGDSDIVLSKAHVFSNQVLFRCELYRKVDTGNVFYKTLAAPEFLRGRECAICGGKGNARAEKVHILRTSQAEPLPGVNDWGCGEQNCTWCSSQPTQEEDTGSLQDEARSLESILRKWFSDTKVRG
ncbi:uncharacterized protein LOC117329731 [Pecten maximus]|uniref:uncharacterized protein LOC117329731 n=1 Tax=Pecten maximus TaxID=6579 RepID=UPI0014585DAC|nr:uncharacterized protein LOC117329731 [Pecten maximus]